MNIRPYFTCHLRTLCLVTAALSCLAAGRVFAISPQTSPSPDAEDQRIVGTLNGFHPQKGKITLSNGAATLNLPEDLRFLDPGDSRKLLVDIWKNPPEVASGVLGMIIPAKFGNDDEHAWGAMVNYSDVGYIKDEETDYNKLLADIKEAQEKHNEDRVKEGYQPLHIVGWAQPPHYDRDTKKLYWAKELQSGDNPHRWLNYDIRILGRGGALELSIIADMDQLPQINNIVPALLSTVEFNQGNRYADFNPKTDKVAPYALAGLIGGGLLLAKVGAFKGIWLALLAAKKFVIIGLVAIGGFFKRLFGGGTKVNTDKPGPPAGTV